jgi:hypothetical protein
MASFYVYEHWRLDRDECFYVGKGIKNRAYKMSDRNSHHRAILAKLSREGSGMEVRMVATGLTEDESFALEVERIAFWREAGVDLANYTKGGDGVSGLKMSDEAKAKMSAAKKGLPGRITMLGRKHSEETKAKMSAAHSGVKKSPEHAAKVGLRHKGKTFFHTDESRAKMSLSQTGRKMSDEARENMRAAWVLRKLEKEKMGAKS